MPRKKSAFFLVVALLALTVSTPPAYAQDNNAFAKLMRGTINILTGWLELPINTAEGLADPEGFLQPIVGLTEGIIKGTQRTFYGVWDLVTFPLPPYDKPVMDPDILIRPESKPLIR